VIKCFKAWDKVVSLSENKMMKNIDLKMIFKVGSPKFEIKTEI
jgi:hypothetical protein